MTNLVPRQLLLGVEPDTEATLANFYISELNAQLLQSLNALLGADEQQILLLWGASDVGKTHLLQAMCQQFTVAGKSSIYLPLKDAVQTAPEILDGLEQLSLVCLDDIEQVLRIPEWENALFHFHNRIQDSGTSVLIGSNKSIAHSGIDLPDLYSRLQQAIVFQVHELSDSDKQAMLQLRASESGIILSDSVLEYILQRSNRRVSSLLSVMTELALQSLEQKRRITIPLVKQVMHW